MTQLLIHAGPTAPDAAVLRTGGVPLAPAGFAWPTCATCEGNMQFLAHLPVAEEQAVAVFMCQNDPGLCDEWSPDEGGNRAVVLDGPLVPVAVPAEGETTLDVVSTARVEDVAGASYGDARATSGEQQGASPREVIGGLGGEPDWIQGDETPTCEGCDGPMPFVAQLEEGADHTTAMNFGGGVGYVFACLPHRAATFLWQC